MPLRSARSVLAAATAALACSTVADAATQTATFRVSATVQSECTIGAANVLFGTIGILTGNIDVSSSITVTCTSGTAYTIALDKGTVVGSTIEDRKMGSGANVLGFQLYTDVARTTIWGDTAGQTQGGTGNGAAQTVSVYGRVPPQVTPPAGAYETQITATINY